MMSVTQIFSARAILIQSRSTSCPSASVATTRKAGHCLCRSREPNVSRQRPMKSRSLRMACSGVPSYHNSGAPETAGVNPFVAPPAELMLDCRNVLGESPVWCTRRNLLYWVDIEEQHLHSFDPLASAPEGHQWWPLPDRPGCVALTETDGRFILAFKGGVSVWEQETEKITQLAAFEPDFPTTRMNDGRADRDGRLVVGGYNEAHSIDGGRAIASLYRLGTDGGVSRVLGWQAVLTPCPVTPGCLPGWLPTTLPSRTAPRRTRRGACGTLVSGAPRWSTIVRPTGPSTSSSPSPSPT
eukprot:jgi/Mesvir1/15161/Mv04843-RA.3